MAHFDFVVYNEDFLPEFAVEFDGPTHQDQRQQERDKKKNHLCHLFSLPLLRIKHRHISRKYNEMTLLSWIVNVYYLEIAFYEAQEAVPIPDDETFDPFSFMTVSKQLDYPYWISRKASIHIQKMHKERKIQSFPPSIFIGKDKEENYRGIGYIKINRNYGISFESAMRSQGFPIKYFSLLGEILIIFLHEKIENYFKGMNI